MSKKKTFRLGSELSSNKLRINSVQRSSAQNAIQCDPVKAFESSLLTMVSSVVTANWLSNIEKGIILLLLEHGLRISEVLRLDSSSVLPGSRLLVRGLKRSTDRLISGISYFNDLSFFLTSFGRFDTVYSRFYIYRCCRKLNISFESSSSQRISVTHAGRHLFAEILNSSGVSIENVASFIGHKSTKSTQHYVGKSISKK